MKRAMQHDCMHQEDTRRRLDDLQRGMQGIVNHRGIIIPKEYGSSSNPIWIEDDDEEIQYLLFSFQICLCHLVIVPPKGLLKTLALLHTLRSICLF